MHSYIKRDLEAFIQKRLMFSPVVAILGPRQCGKSSIAQQFLSPEDIYLDLENPDDFQKLQMPMAFLDENQNKLICLDEIQRYKNMFELLRGHVDRTNKAGQFLILGSASRDLIQQSSETLAGRISYLTLSPFLIQELPAVPLKTLWLQGGYPRSILAHDLEESMIWRRDYIQSYLERDIPQLGLQITTSQMSRLWRMLAHLHAQVLNKAKLANALGVTNHTVQRYIDILKETFMIYVLEPFHPNIKKRIIKSPKIYISDSGILHALLNIDSFNELLGHPNYGSSWEGFVIHHILQNTKDWQASYYRTSNGTEIDLILEKKNETIAIEIKASMAPKVSGVFFKTLQELSINEAYVVAPIKSAYPLTESVKVTPLAELIKRFI